MLLNTFDLGRNTFERWTANLEYNKNPSNSDEDDENDMNISNKSVGNSRHGSSLVTYQKSQATTVEALQINCTSNRYSGLHCMFIKYIPIFVQKKKRSQFLVHCLEIFLNLIILLLVNPGKINVIFVAHGKLEIFQKIYIMSI